MPQIQEIENPQRLIDSDLKSLNAIIDYMGIGVGITDNKGNTLKLNKKALEIHGFRNEDEVFSFHRYTEEFELQFSDGCYMPIEEWPLSRALQQDFVHDYPVKLIRKKDGKAKFINYNVFPVFNDNGDLSNIVLNMEDHTDFYMANEALKESERRYFNLFNTKTNGVVHCKVLTNDSGDPIDYRFIKVNDAYSSITGIRREQIEGKLVREAFPGIEDDPFDYIGNLGKIALEGGELNVELYFDQLEKWFSIYAYSGKEGEFTAIFNDITPRKINDEKLKQKEAELLETQRIARIGSWNLNINPDSKDSMHAQMCIYSFDPISQSLSSNIEQSVIFYDSNSWKLVNHAVYDALQHGENFEIDVEAKRDGKPIWVTMRGEAVRGKNKEISGLKGTIQDITERKIAEKTMQRERELFESIFNNIPVMITIFDIEMSKFEFNTAFKRLTGYNEEDAQNGDLMAMIYPDPEYRKCVAEYMKELKPGWSEFVMHTKHGELLDSAWANIQLSHGVFIGIGIDMRERKKAELALKESEQRLRELADNIAPLTWVADKYGDIYWFSKRWYDYTGSSPEESLNGGWKKYHHPEFIESVIENYNKSITEGKNWEMIFPLKRNDGIYRWYLSRATPIRDNNNQIIRWFGSNSDIHDQRHNEQRLEGMFNSAGIGIVEVDTQDRLIAVNQRICNILGYTKEELLGKTVFDITYAQDLLISEKVNKQIHDGSKNIFAYEKRYVKKDGTPVWVNVTVSAVRDHIGKHVNSIGTIEDISERKKFEEALMESEKRFRLLADNISQMAWISDASGNFLWFNKRWHDFTGVSLEEMNNGGHYKVNHPDFREKVFDKFKKHLENGKPWEDIYPMLGRNGEYRWFLSTAQPIYDENGSISLWFGTATDINKQINSEEALRQSEQRLQGVFDNAAIGICEVDEKDNFIAVNDWLCRILGYSREELLKKNVVDITYSEDREHSRELNEKLQNGEFDVFDFEKRYIKKDGTRFWVHVSVSIVRDSSGNRVRSVRTIEDITERKNAQEAILRSETILKHAGMMANLGAWDIDLNDLVDIQKNQFHISDETYRILGFDPGSTDLSLEKFLELIHPDDQDKLRDVLMNTVVERKPFKVEHRIRRNDGNERIVIQNAEVFFDSSNHPVRIIGAMQDVTEQKLAEQRLLKALDEAEEGRNILNALMAYIPLGVTIGEIPDAKVRLESRYGKQLLESIDPIIAEINDKKFEYGLYHIHNLKKATPEEIPLTRAVKTGEIIKNEEWFVARYDGSLIPILCNAAPILDKSGKITGGIIAWQDITERRKILKELQNSEESLRLVIESAQLGTWDFDIDTGIANHSARHDQIFGYSEPQKEWSYEISIQHILPEYHEIVRDSVTKAIESGILFYEAKIRWPDGSLHWIAPHGRVYYDNDGKPLRMVGIVSDITERKNAEEALKESEEKFRSLFENITEGVAIHEIVYIRKKPVNYKIIDANPAFKQYHKIEQEIPVGTLASELFHTCDLPYLNEYAEVAKTQKPYRFEAYFQDINKHFIINVISPQIGQFATVFEDISEQKKNEQEMKQRNEELTRFIYTVSHDLKSPLVTIKSFTSYLKEDIENNDKEAQDKDISYIENATDKMGKLLNELLELSRIGRKEEPKNEIQILQVVQAAIDLVAGRISEKKVHVFISAPPLHFKGFSQRMVQLFQNLIDNAVKFMGKQSNPEVEIGAFKDASRNNEWVIFVKDNGIGIDPRYHHKIFGLFEKLDNSAEGTGIGLALIKRIVEVHEGNIWFNSEGAGKGTTFYFTLKGLKNG